MRDSPRILFGSSSVHSVSNVGKPSVVRDNNSQNKVTIELAVIHNYQSLVDSTKTVPNSTLDAVFILIL